MTDLTLQLKQLIVDALMLEDTTAQAIESDAPLFGEGLGLDSVDALELGMAIQRKYGITIKPNDDRNRQVFYSVNTLAAFINEQSSGKDGGDDPR